MEIVACVIDAVSAKDPPKPWAASQGEVATTGACRRGISTGAFAFRTVGFSVRTASHIDFTLVQAVVARKDGQPLESVAAIIAVGPYWTRTAPGLAARHRGELRYEVDGRAEVVARAVAGVCGSRT